MKWEYVNRVVLEYVKSLSIFIISRSFIYTYRSVYENKSGSNNFQEARENHFYF